MLPRIAVNALGERTHGSNARNSVGRIQDDQLELHGVTTAALRQHSRVCEHLVRLLAAVRRHEHEALARRWWSAESESSCNQLFQVDNAL